MSSVPENIQERYEQKFVFEQKHSTFVEEIVKTHPANFHEIFQQRQINNIYFDKLGFKFYADHKDGNPQCKKVRIRWYGNTFDQINYPVLEYKYRNGDIRIKKSYPLPAFNNENGCNSTQIKEVLVQANLPDYVREEIEELEAYLVNSYTRRYFRSFDNHYRFTIDQNLEYFKFMQEQKSFLQKEIDENRVVLELKFGLEFALEIIKLNTKLPIQDYVFSKYVSGMEKVYSYLF
ncbi:MAG: VTC domain-containing protein [Bacteroidales bacterium]|nr:VTC domain-containing protein [Bacteroidales bacterium]